MFVYEVRMFERCTGNVIATYLGGAESPTAAKLRCVQRAYDAGRIDDEEKLALDVRIATPRVNPRRVDTGQWFFTATGTDSREA